MPESEFRTRRLGVPETSPVNYPRNLIKQAVCELKFPTLLSLGDSKPPAKFAHALRKVFPEYQLMNDVSFSQNSADKAIAHSFRAKKGQWTVTIRQSTITLETNKYHSYELFREKLELVVSASAEVIDSDFYTRIGLRYINAVPYERETLANWVNVGLVQPLVDGIYGDPVEYSGRISRVEADWGFNISHGIGQENGRGPREYFLDIDFYQEDVELINSMSVVDKLHADEFDMFSWAIGSAAKKYMGDGVPKGTGGLK